MAEPLNGAPLIENGWFLEKNSQWPGQANALQVKEVLLQKKTKYQDLLVFASTNHGNVIVLDGVIQITERDEMSYQEMLAHLPMFSCDPKQVLIIGGGDGGVLREVVKHSCVEKVTWCEIDGDVVEAAKRFLPSVAKAVGDPKVELLVGDGVAFAENSKENSYDVIIVDSSDPVGPAEKLFSKEFYVNAERILKPGGVICSQGECLWLNEVAWAPFKANALGEHENSFPPWCRIMVPALPVRNMPAFRFPPILLGRLVPSWPGRVVARVRSLAAGHEESPGRWSCVTIRPRCTLPLLHCQPFFREGWRHPTRRGDYPGRDRLSFAAGDMAGAAKRKKTI
eukprot:s2505_g4.t3